MTDISKCCTILTFSSQETRVDICFVFYTICIVINSMRLTQHVDVFPIDAQDEIGRKLATVDQNGSLGQAEHIPLM